MTMDYTDDGGVTYTRSGAKWERRSRRTPDGQLVGKQGARLWSLSKDEMPLLDPRVTLLSVDNANGNVFVAQTSTDKRAMLKAEAGGSHPFMVLAVWPGKVRSNVFLVDDVVAAAGAVGAVKPCPFKVGQVVYPTDTRYFGDGPLIVEHVDRDTTVWPIVVNNGGRFAVDELRPETLDEVALRLLKADPMGYLGHKVRLIRDVRAAFTPLPSITGVKAAVDRLIGYAVGLGDQPERLQVGARVRIIAPANDVEGLTDALCLVGTEGTVAKAEHDVNGDGPEYLVAPDDETHDTWWYTRGRLNFLAPPPAEEPEADRMSMLQHEELIEDAEAGRIPVEVLEQAYMAAYRREALAR